MTSQEPSPSGSPSGSSEEIVGQVSAVALRLMAGTVSRRTFEGLQRTVAASPAEYPWQVVTKVVLSEPVDDQKVLQQALRAQRDWVLRGGREQPGKSAATHAKTFLAKLIAQLLFAALFGLVLVVGLLVVKYKWPEMDIYRLLDWIYAILGRSDSR